MKERRAYLEELLLAEGAPHLLSAAQLQLHEMVISAITETAHGQTLEVGSGWSPYAGAVEAASTSVIRLDISDARGPVDVIGDIENMVDIRDGSFDTVLCTEVLEHVPHPARALSECRRVLRPGGTLILSVPHLSMVHEAPHDYFRFTEYGIRILAADAGFELRSVEPTGGLVSFLLHTVSVGMMSLVGTIPWLGRFGRLVNRVLLVELGRLVDGWMGLSSIFPRGHVAVLTVPGVDRPQPATSES